jgi:hypothetical protein
MQNSMKLDRLCSLAVCFLLIAANTATTQQKREIKTIGCFVNVRSDDQHADGYSVKLWRFGSRIIGLIDHHRGLLGDPPIGMLSEVQYDPLTEKFSFEAGITDGIHYCREHADGIPSQDMVLFKGFLKPDRLEGTIILEGRSDSKPRVLDRRDHFVMRRDDNCSIENCESYDVWWWYWKPVFDTRGPKW